MIIERDDVSAKSEDIERMTAEQLRSALRRERVSRVAVDERG